MVCWTAAGWLHVQCIYCVAGAGCTVEWSFKGVALLLVVQRQQQVDQFVLGVSLISISRNGSQSFCSRIYGSLQQTHQLVLPVFFYPVMMARPLMCLAEKIGRRGILAHISKQCQWRCFGTACKWILRVHCFERLHCLLLPAGGGQPPP